MSFLLVKSTQAFYALVVIQEHNIILALSHTCEKHSQCISLYKCTLFVTDPLDVRVGWYHIWRCFNRPERLMRGACLNKSPLERICCFVELPAQKPPLKAANMYWLLGWMARNSHLLAFLEHQNWERNVSDTWVLWGRPGVQQSSMCVQVLVRICLSLSMLWEPYPLASYSHILLYDFPGNHLNHPRQKETSKHCCLSPPHVTINQSELKAMPTAMIYEYITGLIGIL